MLDAVCDNKEGAVVLLFDQVLWLSSGRKWFHQVITRCMSRVSKEEVEDSP